MVMAHDLLLLHSVNPIEPTHSKENLMLTLTLFFAAGILLGVIGLRLLSRWEIQRDKRPTNFRHHS
jgi:hypothetical protein